MVPKAIIFDCDGTLVDTEYMSAFAMTEMLNAHGIFYEPEAFLQEFIGRAHGDMLDIINARHGTHIPLKESEEVFADLVMQRIPTHMKVLPESLALVRDLAKNYKIAVASNGHAITVFGELRAGGYLDLISEDAVFTRCDVANPKPAPDLYLHAAEYLGVEPSACLVVEDSATGVQAGVAAGMTVIGYTGMSHDPDAQCIALEKAGCARVVGKLTDIL